MKQHGDVVVSTVALCFQDRVGSIGCGGLGDETFSGGPHFSSMCGFMCGSSRVLSSGTVEPLRTNYNK